MADATPRISEGQDTVYSTRYPVDGEPTYTIGTLREVRALSPNALLPDSFPHPQTEEK